MKADRDIVVSEAGAERWNALVASMPGHTIFHSREWVETIAAAHGVKPVLAVAHRNGEVVGLWPLLIMRKGPLRVLGSPLPGWSTAYMGPLVAGGADASGVVNAFLRHRLFRRYAYFACRTMETPRHIDLASHGFTIVDRFDTYLIDLDQGEQALWDNLKSECRTRIRKAEKLGIEVREETNGAFIDDFWGMSIETFQKSNIQPTHTREFVVALWRRLGGVAGAGGAKRLLVLSAFQQGERAATLVLPFDDHSMYYWGGASYQRFRDLPVNNLLHWRAILEAQRRGLRHYDFVSTRGGPGRFKKTFGPRVVDICTHWERSPSKLMAMLKRRYEAFARARRRVEQVTNDE